jgi:peptide/nickel transport system permease protein
VIQQIGRRLTTLLPVLAVVGLTVFVLMHLVPGDPAAVMAGPDATVARVEELRREMGLDRPLAAQLGRWLASVVRGDLGDSYFLQEPVAVSIGKRLEPTGLLTLYALLVACAIGVPAGIAAALLRNSWVDRLAMATALAGVSIPGFWLGILLILLFAVRLHLLPAAGYVPFLSSPFDNARYLLMPAFSLGVAQAGFLARIVRSSMLDILREDYVRTARAKGVHERLVLVRHVFRNALIPVLTSLGLAAGVLLGGAVVTETVFNVPGVGRLIVQSVLRRDFPVIQGAVLFLATVYVLVNLAVDIAYLLADPRIRHGQR